MENILIVKDLCDSCSIHLAVVKLKKITSTDLVPRTFSLHIRTAEILRVFEK